MLKTQIVKTLSCISVLILISVGMISPVNAQTINVANMKGFSASNATKYLQKAFDSDADKVIVPNIGKPYVVTPLKIASNNQTIIFKPGVVILAKKGKFHGRSDMLVRLSHAKNVTIKGKGATFRMRKKDYDGKKYTHSEHRHGLAIYNSKNITIEGLKIEKTGGDGIYIRNNNNLTIRDCKLINNYRQGISITSSAHVLIENVLMKGTKGTPPQAGIDIEPGTGNRKRHEPLRDIVLRNCKSIDNTGGGYVIPLKSLDSSYKNVSITLENCVANGNGSSALLIDINNKLDKIPDGKLFFKDCTFRNDKANTSVFIRNKPSSILKLVFTNCNIYQANSKGGSPVFFTTSNGVSYPVGGVEFKNCNLINVAGSKPISFITHSVKSHLENITGTLIVSSNNGDIKNIKLAKKLLEKWIPGQDFESVPYLDLEKVNWKNEDYYSKEKYKLSGLKVHRNPANYALYANKGDNVKLKFHYGQISNNFHDMKINVKDPDGESVYKNKFPVKKTSSFNFTAKKTGLYILNINVSSNTIDFLSSTNPINLITSKEGSYLHETNATLYFWVPKGTKKFAIRGAGVSTQGFRIKLKDSSGKLVKDIDDVVGLKQITVEPDKDQTGKIWSLYNGKATNAPFWDHTIVLLGIPPLLAPSKETVIKSK